MLNKHREVLFLFPQKVCGCCFNGGGLQEMKYFQLSNRFLFMFAGSWIAGIITATYLNVTGFIYCVGLFVLTTSLFIIMTRSSPRLLFICLIAFIAASGQKYWMDHTVGVSKLAKIRAEQGVEGDETNFTVSGEITKAALSDGDRIALYIQSEEVNSLLLKENFIIHIKLHKLEEQQLALQLVSGVRIHIKGTLVQPKSAGNIGGFDYSHFLKQQHIYWLIKVDSVKEMKIIGKSARLGSNVKHYTDKLRNRLALQLDALLAEKKVDAGFLKGLLIGVRDDIDPALYKNFAEIGITHILAISGLHVAVFIAVCSLLLRQFRLTREKISIVLLVLLPIYILLSGASPSVLRAGIMAMLGILLYRAGRLKDSLRLVAATGWLLLLWNPYYLFNISFQLSFIVTIGLIKGFPALRKWLPSHKYIKGVSDTIAITVTAQLISFPLTIYYFNQFHLLSLLSNLVFIPLISIIVLPLGFVAFLLSFIWFGAAQFIFQILSYIHQFIFWGAKQLASVKILSTIWASPPIWWVVIWLAGSLFFFHVIKNKKMTVKMTASIALSSTVLLVYAYQHPHWGNEAIVSFLDVGQGDSALVRTPKGKRILIDGGGSVLFRRADEEWRSRRDPYEVGEKTVVPLLKKRGVQQLDVIIISHLDSDHIGGLLAVLEHIPVKEIWWNQSVKHSRDTIELFKLALEKKVRLYGISGITNLELEEEASFRFLWPPIEGSGEKNDLISYVEDQNEYSAVFDLQLKGHYFLFTGDINQTTEGIILQRLQGKQPMDNEPEGGPYRNKAQSSWMKAAHHGSKHSSGEQWMSYWKPDYTVISSGENNRYGHPHADALHRIQKSGSSIWRIDQQGELMIKITSDNLFIYK